MSQVDIRRFVGNISELFAPTIDDGQVFFAFIDEEENFYSVLGNNLLSGNVQKDIEKISAKVSILDTQVDNIQDGCSDLPTIRNQIQSLQSDITALQSTSGGSSSGDSGSGASIITVDDIIWGVFDASDENSSLPANLKTMRGRQYLDVNDNNYSLPTFLVVNFFSSGQPLYDGSVYCDEIYETKVLAAFYDGKIYTVDESGIMSSKNLNDGDAFLNKADNSLYVFDAQNHKFIRTGGNHHYTVDMFIDYIGSTWPSNIPDGGMLILKPESYSSYVKWKGYYEYVDSRYYANFSLNNATSFANISNELTDDACIYSYIPEGGSEAFIRVIHELYDGDTIYNKADGCTYTFSANGNNKSFVRISEPTIPPVCDILHVVTRLSQVTPSAAGDKCIWYEPEDNNYSGYLFTADSNLEWGDGTQIENNEFYASLDNHKIYSFRGWSDRPFMPVTIPAGVPFFNKADNSLYVFDGTQFIKITSS